MSAPKITTEEVKKIAMLAKMDVKGEEEIDRNITNNL